MPPSSRFGLTGAEVIAAVHDGTVPLALVPARDLDCARRRHARRAAGTPRRRLARDLEAALLQDAEVTGPMLEGIGDTGSRAGRHPSWAARAPVRDHAAPARPLGLCRRDDRGTTGRHRRADIVPARRERGRVAVQRRLGGGGRRRADAARLGHGQRLSRGRAVGDCGCRLVAAPPCRRREPRGVRGADRPAAGRTPRKCRCLDSGHRLGE